MSPGPEHIEIPVGKLTFDALAVGPPGGELVLLLHGFPQTHLCWDRVAPALAERHTVVLADLRGYGASTAPPGGPRGDGYTKREMAAELVQVMAGLGHERFAVVGHDRGARVGYRMALDHPGVVDRLAVLNVIPTLDQFERMSGGPSLGYWPWVLLAQPAPMPERLLGADPEAVLDHVFATWPADPAAIDPDHRAAYLAAMTPSTVAAMCGDYRATSTSTSAMMPTTEKRAGASPHPCSSSPEPRRRNSPTRATSGDAGPSP